VCTGAALTPNNGINETPRVGLNTQSVQLPALYYAIRRTYIYVFNISLF